MDSPFIRYRGICVYLSMGGGRMIDTVIHRQRKYEAEQAISDLLERGFEVVYPLTEIKRDGKSFATDSYKRKIFQYNTYSSCWIAKLRRLEQ